MNNSPSIFDLFVIDIETVPQFQSYNQLSDTWKELWWDKISKTVPENITPEESYNLRAGILAEFGKIICVSTGYFYEDDTKNLCFKIKSIYGDDEKQLLKDLFSLTDKMYKHNKQFSFAGHNIREFDVPYICRRAIINQLALPDYLQLHGAKPWEIRLTDTLQWWKFGDYKNYVSLHLLANVLGIETSKTDMDGSMVQDVYYIEKNLTRIVDYCQRDVVVTANVILRFNNNDVLEEKNITIVS
jgi:hypothetical protein